jgi:hypothetical protein
MASFNPSSLDETPKHKAHDNRRACEADAIGGWSYIRRKPGKTACGKAKICAKVAVR